MRMQDEVHRFRHHLPPRTKSKAMHHEIFDEVEGLGEKRKEVLRKHYPTLESRF
jgi:excinuclease ABC subunit C